MDNVLKCIRERRSVRTYNGDKLSEEHIKLLVAYGENIVNPFNIPVTFKFLNGKENGLVCPVISGTDLFIGGKIIKHPDSNFAFGYSFERFILYAQSIGIGTVWLGGTFNRPVFEKAMELSEDEFMPCATPVGYIAAKMNLRESLMRKNIKADERMPFEELFFKDSFDNPLRESEAGELAISLEMVRLSPSAVNKQPWRVIISENYVHFYLKRSKGFPRNDLLDMQAVDMGIALCHFELSAQSMGMKTEFFRNAPSDCSHEYIASFKIY